MPPDLRSRVTLRPNSIVFDETDPVPKERTYARDYSTDHVLGEGGMGKVIAARDENLGRRVAIKQLRAEVRGRADLRSRFIREAQIGGQLEHPNIVPIYAFEFSPEGGPAFVMQLVDGESLTDYIERARQNILAHLPETPSVKERVAMILPICNAMAYAHGRGVLHRDLKPDNVMLGPHNVVLVTDWGIARVDSDISQDETPDWGRDTCVPDEPHFANGDLASSKTVSSEIPFSATVLHAANGPRSSEPAPDSLKTTVGAVMGTPQYMSPEQAMGVRVEQASDQYALGLMCLELATLRTPRSHENTSTAYAQAILGEQCSHVDINGVALDVRLSAIISRATQKDASARYASIEALAEDLKAFLLDEEVSVLPDSRARKFLRALQKHPVRSVVVGAIVLLMLATWAIVSTGSAATRATAARKDAEALSKLSSAVLSEGREIERFLLEMDGDLVGLAQTVRVRLDVGLLHPDQNGEIIQPADLRDSKRAGIIKNTVDGTLRSYREPVFVFAPQAEPQAQIDARLISASKSDLVDLYLASISESAHNLPQVEQETLMASDQRGIVRLMIALESGLFVQFPGRPDFEEDFDARNVDWYKKAFSASGHSFSRPKYGPLGKIPRMAVTRPIESKGRIIGVVAAGFWLKPLVDRLGEGGAPHLQNAFLAAPDGKEIASHELLRTATHGEAEAPVTLANVRSKRLRDVLAAKKETGYLVDGENLYVYTRLAVEDWILVHQYPNDQYLKLVH